MKFNRINPYLVIFVISILAVTLLSAGVLPSAPLPASADEGKTLLYMDGRKAPAYDEADAAVIGTVIEKSSYWNEERTSIYSSVVLSVDEVLAGEIHKDTVTVTYAGGEVDGIGQWVSEMPGFSRSEKAAVLLKEIPSGQFPSGTGALVGELPETQFAVCGGVKGKFSVVDNKVGGMTVSEFKENVSRVIEGRLDPFEEAGDGPASASFPYLYSGLRWPGTSPVINFRVNENTADCTGEGAAVRAAAETWSAAGARFSFNYAGTTSVTESGANGVNEVFWGDHDGGTALAVAIVWYYPSTSTIFECDMEFNDNYAWSNDGAQFDVQSIALHEFGHFLMLNDLYNPADSAKVMYGYGAPGTTKRSLHADDIAGIKAIYGTSTVAPAVTNGSVSSITGTSARLNGEVTATGGENPAVHICWGPADGGAAPGSWSNDINLGTKGAGAFYLDINGLSAGTAYYYRCYAVNSAGKSWAAATTSFITMTVLTMTVSGNGTTVPPAGDHLYDPGSTVDITAEPGVNWAFIDWGGDVTDNTSATTNVTMDASKTVTANFTRTHGTLTLTVGGSGNITPASGNHTYPVGTPVNITAVPASGWRFSNWAGDTGAVDNATSANTTVLMNGDYSISANFTRPVLTMAVSGSGTVTPEIGGHAYDLGSNVTITAVPAVNWAFVNWSGDVSDNISSTTNVTMNEDKTVIANFARTHGTLTITVGGSGGVTPATGNYTYPVGTSVNMTAVPAAGWRFINWTGDVSTVDKITSANATIIMNGDYAVTAHFARPALTISVNGNGSTTPGTGTHAYDYGSAADIAAVPASGWRFVNWTGDTGTIADVNSGSTNITMTGDYNIAANFAVVNPGGGGGAGGGGGGSSGADGKTTTGLRGGITGRGVLMEDIEAKSFNRQAILDIPRGTVAKDKNGNALFAVRIFDIQEPDAPQPGAAIVGTVYEFGPAGATFDPPVNLAIKYKDRDLPDGVTEGMLCMATWDDETGAYVPIEYEIDAEVNVITGSVSHFSRYTILALPRPAEFTLSGLSVAPSTVYSGDSVGISVTVANTGDLSGNYTAELMVNSRAVASRNTVLDAGGQITLHFTVPAGGEGTYSVGIGGLTGTYNVILIPASFEIGSLAISPEEVDIGQEAEISVIASNSGQAGGVYEINLDVNGEVIETKKVTLSGGDSREILFIFTADEPGKKVIDVNGLTGVITVREKAVPTPAPLPAQETRPPEISAPPPPGVDWGLVFGIFCGCAVAAAGILYFVRRRKQNVRTGPPPGN